jgi:hypothetical protein
VDERSGDQVVKNEALFRDVNERVKRIDAAHGLPQTELWEFLCECGHADCIERVSLTVDEYERVRSSPINFLVVPGHELPEVEHVVELTERYAVVEKDPQERRVALETDPRL